MKSKALARFITQNGIKKSWFAAKMGISRKLLDYYLEQKKTLAPELSMRARKTLVSIAKNSRF